MDKRNLYEKKIINDEEFPVQFIVNSVSKKGQYFSMHWHEHIELHYIVKGSGFFYCNQKKIKAEKGAVVIFNSNETHAGIMNDTELEAIVMIFELSSFSKEVAHTGFIFENLIQSDSFLQEKLTTFYQENKEKEIGYKLIAKGILYEVIAHLIRNHVALKLSESENSKRNKQLIRLNTVIEYIGENYTEPISNQTLANLIHLSEDRFNHLFKEGMGQSPLNYMNELRLKKAKNLIQTGEYSISEVALEVGFNDLNHFTRLFRKKYGMAPSKTEIKK